MSLHSPPPPPPSPSSLSKWPVSSSVIVQIDSSSPKSSHSSIAFSFSFLFNSSLTQLFFYSFKQCFHTFDRLFLLSFAHFLCSESIVSVMQRLERRLDKLWKDVRGKRKKDKKDEGRKPPPELMRIDQPKNIDRLKEAQSIVDQAAKKGRTIIAEEEDLDEIIPVSPRRASSSRHVDKVRSLFPIHSIGHYSTRTLNTLIPFFCLLWWLFSSDLTRYWLHRGIRISVYPRTSFSLRFLRYLNSCLSKGKRLSILSTRSFISSEEYGWTKESKGRSIPSPSSISLLIQTPLPYMSRADTLAVLDSPSMNEHDFLLRNVIQTKIITCVFEVKRVKGRRRGRGREEGKEWLRYISSQITNSGIERLLDDISHEFSRWFKGNPPLMAVSTEVQWSVPVKHRSRLAESRLNQSHSLHSISSFRLKDLVLVRLRENNRRLLHMRGGGRDLPLSLAHATTNEKIMKDTDIDAYQGTILSIFIPNQSIIRSLPSMLP